MFLFSSVSASRLWKDGFWAQAALYALLGLEKTSVVFGQVLNPLHGASNFDNTPAPFATQRFFKSRVEAHRLFFWQAGPEMVLSSDRSSTLHTSPVS